MLKKVAGRKTEKFESWYLWLIPVFFGVCYLIVVVVVVFFFFFFNDCCNNNETRFNLVVDFSLWIRTQIKKRFSLSVVGRKGVGGGGGGSLSIWNIMAHTGRLRLKGRPFQLRLQLYQSWIGNSWIELYERVRKPIITQAFKRGLN